ncbi:DUF2334 domain-containing protein [Paenibacillus sp. SYP-B3998]|uniref:DUF2334 domain-containing protein n=1 Tax=Paenibacillus sp. SYP-B3998 TaxID=2678564 RepID=A0A6G3ZS55_9BACL|nr:polysaccharide deacetylase family protein [Paenibacillus sp. SYP-B3998]NEW04972.1 DUF2334 domain-containing protein [Paenibacillus sp. SYP-B3998]
MSTAFSNSPNPIDPKVLVIYSADSDSINESVRLLDLLLGQFAQNVSFKEDESVTSNDLQNITHLVYYGGIAKKLPAPTIQLITEFKGQTLAIGENVDQLSSRFSFMTTRSETAINQISKVDPSTKEPIFQLLEVNYPITQVELKQGTTLFQGWRGDLSFPLFIQYENSAYYASHNLYNPFNLYLSEGLASFFGKPLRSERLASIRLEDVHPQSDPKLLKETGDYLADKGIPFMIALIPVYTNPETKKQYHLSDSPQIVEVLRYLQDRGASILLHGYTHQYRSTETGEGFEFWDVRNNTPIWGPSDSDTKVKKRFEFSSKDHYDSYMEGLQAFEETYVNSRIESGIRELTDLGLYPLGFEAPHYVMSQAGYEIVSHYFNYLLGQTQISDNDWEHMGVSPYQSAPTFLHGMTLLPETIGFYDNTSLTPESDLDQKISEMLFIQDGMLGMFYHPYLGLDKLETLISHVEHIPNLNWLDLRKMNASVRTPNLTITTDPQGQINYRNASPHSEQQQVVQTIKRLGSVEVILWGIAILVTIMVLLFILYTFSMRMNLRKQLFEERNISG